MTGVDKGPTLLVPDIVNDVPGGKSNDWAGFTVLDLSLVDLAFLLNKRNKMNIVSYNMVLLQP